MSDRESVDVVMKWRDKSFFAHRPFQASIELTNRCNERCTHCYIPSYKDDPKRVLTLEQWQHVLSQLKNAGAMYLILMGGEAMLNPHFWGIAEDAARKGFYLSMITNGLKIDEDSGRRLADVGFASVTVSLYSMNPVIHDRMTKVPGSHAKTVRAIEILQKNGIMVGVNCLLTRESIDEIFDVFDWCTARRIKFRADPVVTPKFDGDLGPTKYRATFDQLREYYRKLIERNGEGAVSPNDDKPTDYVCNVGKGKCAVTAYGELLTCIEVREPLGSLVTQSFDEIWNGPTAQKWREMTNQQIKSNLDGPTKGFCEHCPGMALHETGDATQMLSYAQELAKIKAEAYRNRRGSVHEEKLQDAGSTGSELSEARL